jgi:dolichol-phosphate mannosyltransferase
MTRYKGHLVTCIIPTRNEERTIARAIRGAQRHVDEVLVVDGHSRDLTRELAKAAGARVVLDNGRGKGEAMRWGLRHARGDVVVYMDADGSHDPDDIRKLLAPIVRGEADYVMGSRIRGGSDELWSSFDEILRLLAALGIAAFVNQRFKTHFSDVINGFKAARTECLRSLDLVEDGQSIEHEMVVKALRKGYRVTEVPTHEYARKFGASALSLWKHGPRFAYSLFKYLYFS